MSKDVEKRRRKVMEYDRQGLTRVEIAAKLDQPLDVINDDMEWVKAARTQKTLGNQPLLEKNINAQYNLLNSLTELDEESWKIYYSTENPMIRLQAIEKIRQNAAQRAQVLKVVSNVNVHVDKMYYVQEMIPIFLNKIIDVVMGYTPKEKQIELLERLQVIDVEAIEKEAKEISKKKPRHQDDD